MSYNPTWIQPDPAIMQEDVPRFNASFRYMQECLNELLHSYGTQDEIQRAMPILATTRPRQGDSVYSIQILLNGKYTQGTGRFIADMLSTYLIPGKYTCIISNRASRVVVCGKKAFFSEYLVEIADIDDHSIFEANISSVLRLLKTTIQGGVYLRKMLDKKKLTELEKRMIIHQNFADLSDESFGPFRNNFSNEFARSANTSAYAPVLGSLIKERSTTFRRDLFHTMQKYYFSLPIEIGKTASPKSHGKILGLLFYFKKLLQVQRSGAFGRVIPYKRVDNKYKSLMVLFCSAEADHDLLKVIQTCKKVVPQSKRVDDFSIEDSKTGCLIGTYGVFLEKSDGSFFTNTEYTMLKREFVKTLETHLPLRPISSLDSLLSLSSKVRLATSEKHSVLIEKLTQSILAAKKEDKALLTSYISSFTHLPDITDESLRPLLTGYYMLYELIEKGEKPSPCTTSAQRVEDYFILSVTAQSQLLRTSAANFLQKYTKRCYTSAFTFADNQFVLMIFPYDSKEDLLQTRDTIKLFIEGMEVDFETGVAYR